jgi:hypothetical protein
MGILHSCDTQAGVIYAVWNGTVTWHDWQEHASALMSEPYWKQSSRFLVDLRSVTNTSSIDAGDIQTARQLFSQNTTAGKRGAVIAANEFRNAQEFRTLIEASGISMVVFNGLDTACIFLGLDFTITSRELERLRNQLRGEDRVLTD